MAIVEGAQFGWAYPFHIPQMEIFMCHESQEAFVSRRICIGPATHHQYRAVFVFQTTAAIFYVLHDECVALAGMIVHHFGHGSAHQLHIITQFFYISIVTAHHRHLMGYAVYIKFENREVAQLHRRIHQIIEVGVGEIRSAHGTAKLRFCIFSFRYEVIGSLIQSGGFTEPSYGVVNGQIAAQMLRPFHGHQHRGHI